MNYPRPRHRELCQAAQKWRLTKGEAKSEAKRQEKSNGVLFNAYLCPSCGGWHIGKPRRRR